jgi:ABC-type multidrug transport system fused ATPase/permease subunit
MVACHVARMALGWKVAAMMSRVTLEVVRELTDTLHRKLQRLGMSYFDRELTGRIMARLTSDVGSLLLFLNGGSLQLISDLVLAVAISGVLIWLQWRLALIGLLALPLFVVNHRWFAGSIHELSRVLREQVAALYALLSERVSAVRVVRSFTKEDAELAEFDQRIDAQRAMGWASLKAVARQGAWATLINGVALVSVLAYGVMLVNGGRFTVGVLLAFFGLLTQLYQPIVRLGGAPAMLAATLVAVDGIIEVLDEPEASARGATSLRILRPSGRLIYKDVRFAYSRGGRPVLDQIRLEVEPGMTLGILGASGSGKSTLLALAPRIYELGEGQGAILLDGQDVRGIDLADLRRTVALVPQQAMLFEGTIRSNLTYAAPGADSAALHRALEVTGLEVLVAMLPKGLDTLVGERGQTLSGGQRQRLALARALVADPAVLLLDDCTSAVDGHTESVIQAALREFWLGRGRIVVSHKVSSVRDADWILVLDAGKIVEEGTHETLIRLGGHYARTYRQQTAALLVRADLPPKGQSADPAPRFGVVAVDPSPESVRLATD